MKSSWRLLIRVSTAVIGNFNYEERISCGHLYAGGSEAGLMLLRRKHTALDFS